MEKDPSLTPNTEKEPTPERGANVRVAVDFIRHPEKDPETGKLTEQGKEEFFENLVSELQDNDEYDTVKFYVSPLPRGQEAKEPVSSFLEVSGIKTTIRDKEGLAGRAREIGPELKEEVTRILEERGSLSTEQTEEVRKRDQEINAYEPASKDFETQANELLIKEYFDKKLPGADFTGKEMGEGIQELVDHFSKMSSRLNSGSKVKLILVGHSGITEYFTKYVYMQNHPDVKPEDVDVDTIGGLMDFGEGPEVTIRSDEQGEQEVTLKFKDLELEYDPKR